MRDGELGISSRVYNENFTYRLFVYGSLHLRSSRDTPSAGLWLGFNLYVFLFDLRLRFHEISRFSKFVSFVSQGRSGNLMLALSLEGHETHQLLLAVEYFHLRDIVKLSVEEAKLVHLVSHNLIMEELLLKGVDVIEGERDLTHRFVIEILF